MALNKKTASQKNKSVQLKLTAKQFIEKLSALRPKTALDNFRFFRDDDKTNKSLGVRMVSIFGLAKQFSEMPLDEIENLLESDYYEARMGAVSIMDFQARDKKVSAERKKRTF